MPATITFAEVCAFARKTGSADAHLVASVDRLLGLALVCSPLALGPEAVALLPLLGAKNELAKLGTSVFRKLTGHRDSSYMERQERLAAAHGLIVFTAFFEALDEALPPAFRGKVLELAEDRSFLAKQAEKQAASDQAPDATSRFADTPIPFPHPTEGLSDQAEKNHRLWGSMAEGFQQFAEGLVVWDEASAAERVELEVALSEVPAEAAKRFEAQYRDLALAVPDFAVWANMHEHARQAGAIKEFGDYFAQYVQLAQSNAERMDIGFEGVRSVVQALPKALVDAQAKDIFEGLRLDYRARINDPIWPAENGRVPLGAESLRFPKVSESYIPQSYQVIPPTDPRPPLEKDATWENVERKEHVGAFLVRYLSSPYSTEAPLLVLGHPGSGKSLLTKVLAAQLMSPEYPVIRVELRDVDTDAGVIDQIEATIRNVTDISADAWYKLTRSFPDSPFVIILDGYDELLQATGKAVSTYLSDVQRFQQRQAEQGRPVRVVVTSRVTLIDKAVLPAASTVVRLLEFDQTQREAWIRIWNRANVRYFQETGVAEFQLPPKSPRTARILALAEQPLLLLMLALYDSESNALRRSDNFDRAQLYDSLLRRFVRRELEKASEFFGLSEDEQDLRIRKEMERLGVVALGMYNRQRPYIRSSELNADLEFFDLEREATPGRQGRALSQAELLLGSFFFVHQSKSRRSRGDGGRPEESSAFEFLHNTFGEFLTADYILRRALQEAETLRGLESLESLGQQRAQRLNDADGFDREWFACLVFTPLFSGPVVLEMIREWTPHVLASKGGASDDFVRQIDTIVVNQIQRLLDKRAMPKIMYAETVEERFRSAFGELPLLGHIAIYSMNLILLRAVLDEREFRFPSEQMSVHPDGAAPWDRLIHLWRAWFSLDNLNGITAVLSTARTTGEIAIKARKDFQAIKGRNPLATYMNVAESLGDAVPAASSAVALYDDGAYDSARCLEIANRLSPKEFGLDLAVRVRNLEALAPGQEGDLERISYLASSLIMEAAGSGSAAYLNRIALHIRNTWPSFLVGEGHRPLFPRRAVANALRTTVPSGVVLRAIQASPPAARLLCETGCRIGDSEWLRTAVGVALEALILRAPYGHESGPAGTADFVEWVVRAVPLDARLAAKLAALLHPRALAQATAPRLGRPDFSEWTATLGALRDLGRSGVFRDELRSQSKDLFDLVFLHRLCVREPRAVARWLLTLCRLNASSTFEGVDPGLVEKVLDPWYFNELRDHAPEGGAVWLHVLTAAGSREIVQQLDPELVASFFKPPHLQAFGEDNPQACIDWLEALRAVQGDDALRQFDPDLLKRFLTPSFLADLFDRDALAAVDWLDSVRVIRGDDHFRTLVGELVEHHFNPDLLLDLNLREPMVLMRFLDVLDATGARPASAKLAECLGRMMAETGNAALLAFTLKATRASKSRTSAEELTRLLCGRPETDGPVEALQLLPLSSMGDVRWLAEQTGNERLGQTFDALGR